MDISYFPTLPFCSLKAGGADKESLGPVIAELIALKADFERATGTPFDPPKKTKAQKAPAAAAGKDEKQGGNKVRSVGVGVPLNTPPSRVARVRSGFCGTSGVETGRARGERAPSSPRHVYFAC